MSAKANYFKIGLFTISAVIIIVVAVIILSAGALSGKSFIMETYIKESVQGLEVGSPVKLLGVKIGQVNEITFVDKAYPTEHRYILVRVATQPDDDGNVNIKKISDMLKKEIREGLRVRLASQGLTGTAYLEADYLDPEKNPPLEIDWQPAYLYVPSAPSVMTKITDSAENVLEKLERMKLDELTRDLDKLIKSMTKVLEDDLSPTLQTINKTSREMSESVTELSKSMQKAMKDEVTPMLENARVASGGLPETVARINRTISRIDALIDSRQGSIDETLANIQRVTEDLNELVRDAKQYPSNILFGEPPPRLAPEK